MNAPDSNPTFKLNEKTGKVTVVTGTADISVTLTVEEAKELGNNLAECLLQKEWRGTSFQTDKFNLEFWVLESSHNLLQEATDAIEEALDFYKHSIQCILVQTREDFRKAHAVWEEKIKKFEYFWNTAVGTLSEARKGGHPGNAEVLDDLKSAVFELSSCYDELKSCMKTSRNTIENSLHCAMQNYNLNKKALKKAVAGAEEFLKEEEGKC